MCGIFGIILAEKKLWSKDNFSEDIKTLFKLSQQRGRDSSGLSISTNGHTDIYFRSGDPVKTSKTQEISSMIEKAYSSNEGALAAIGHCRLTTHGSSSVESNHQPTYEGHVIGVLNGIITNAHDLLPEELKTNKSLVSFESALMENDTRTLFRLINKNLEQTSNLEKAVSQTYGKIQGSASIGIFLDNQDLLALATNTGSLYYIYSQKLGILIFTSERSILNDFLKHTVLFESYREMIAKEIKQLLPSHGLITPFSLSNPRHFHFGESGKNVEASNLNVLKEKNKVRLLRVNTELSLKRCTRCIIPHTYPFVEFDDQGVCNYCRIHRKEQVHGEETLLRLLEKYRSKDGSPDCLVGLSGGRDSCYGLHLLKKKYGMNPLAYTFDWGLTTDTARRNQSQICSALGVEHIIRSPDIGKKRGYVRQNIEAWLHNPELGMVPLFMAGDKEFYHYGRQLRQENNIGLTIFCAGQSLEDMNFKVGFTGVDTAGKIRLYGYNSLTKFRVALWYFTQYLKNPRYFNKSLFDSFRMFLVSFVNKDDFIYLFEYIKWEESKIEKVLSEEYGWIGDQKFGKHHWRMGDGQTAFINYCYYSIAGFTEFDQFRSNQIREGLISRKEALELVREDNQIKHESLEYFGQVIGLNMDIVMREIDNFPKLFS